MDDLQKRSPEDGCLPGFRVESDKEMPESNRMKV
jgi:hypothetical protein